MKACMMTDLEGVAGVVSFDEQTYPTGKYYDRAKALLTGEVNAAVDGLLDAGIEDILVVDGHGPGGIVFESMHARAGLLHGRPLPPRNDLNALVGDSDLCLMIGQHAMAGTPDGNLNHTQSSQSVDSYTLNGKPIGEIAQFALRMGALGVPMVFLSGDHAACREADTLLPGITTVAVKRGVSRGAAISMSAEQARTAIRDGVAKAVRRHGAEPIQPLHWPPPYELVKRFFHTHHADLAATAPDVEKLDSQTVRIRGDTILDVIYR